MQIFKMSSTGKKVNDTIDNDHDVYKNMMTEASMAKRSCLTPKNIWRLLWTRRLTWEPRLRLFLRHNSENNRMGDAWSYRVLGWCGGC